jgi:hypothetical protein
MESNSRPCADSLQLYNRAAHVTRDYLLTTFQTKLNQLGKSETAAEIIEKNSYDDVINKSNEFVRQFGVTELPLGFVNGQPIQAGLAHELMNNMINFYFQSTQPLQEMVSNL